LVYCSASRAAAGQRRQAVDGWCLVAQPACGRGSQSGRAGKRQWAGRAPAFGGESALRCSGSRRGLARSGSKGGRPPRAASASALAAPAGGVVPPNHGLQALLHSQLARPVKAAADSQQTHSRAPAQPLPQRCVPPFQMTCAGSIDAAWALPALLFRADLVACSSLRACRAAGPQSSPHDLPTRSFVAPFSPRTLLRLNTSSLIEVGQIKQNQKTSSIPRVRGFLCPVHPTAVDQPCNLPSPFLVLISNNQPHQHNGCLAPAPLYAAGSVQLY
jgi:hypothetical protein